MTQYELLMNVFNTIVDEIKRTPLNLNDDNNWKQTIEIRLPDSTKAFGSIQFCGGDKKPPYLELRFKRVHLRSQGVFQIIDEIKEKPFRNDVIKKDGREPEAIRFHFYEDSRDARELISKIFKDLGENLR